MFSWSFRLLLMKAGMAAFLHQFPHQLTPLPGICLAEIIDLHEIDVVDPVAEGKVGNSDLGIDIRIEFGAGVKGSRSPSPVESITTLAMIAWRPDLLSKTTPMALCPSMIGMVPQEWR